VNQKTHKPKISVVIPAYNEESRKKELDNHLNSIKEYFEKRKILYELIIVLDGPTDNTPLLVEEHKNKNPHIQIIKRDKNKGKGYSIREGLLQTKGDYVLFTDMDGATPIYMLDKFFKEFENGYDIIIGSREIEKDKYIIKPQPFWKEFLGRIGNLLIQTILGLNGIKDTQCGFKAFTSDACCAIMPLTTLDRWGIDFEILMLGKKLGYKIKEVPVEWKDSGTSLVKFKDYFYTLKDLFLIKWNLITNKYGINR